MDWRRNIVRRWCWNHARKWDSEARRQGGAVILEFPNWRTHDGT